MSRWLAGVEIVRTPGGIANRTFFGRMDEELSNPTDLRIFAIAQALEEGYTIERIEELTKIDPCRTGNGHQKVLQQTNRTMNSDPVYPA